MIVVYLFLGFITLFVIAGAIHNAFRADALDEEREELDKYSTHLDERANRLAADEQTIRNLYKELRQELNKRNETRNN